MTSKTCWELHNSGDFAGYKTRLKSSNYNLNGESCKVDVIKLKYYFPDGGSTRYWLYVVRDGEGAREVAILIPNSSPSQSDSIIP